MEQDTHARHTVGIADQSNDLEQLLPPDTLCKSLRESCWSSPGLIANRLPGETQHLAFEGVEFFGKSGKLARAESPGRSSLRHEEFRWPRLHRPDSPDHGQPPRK